MSMPQAVQRQTGLTLTACALVTVAFFAVLGHLTAGFEYWTFEARRRHDAATGQMKFPAMHLMDSAGQDWQLPAAARVG